MPALVRRRENSDTDGKRHLWEDLCHNDAVIPYKQEQKRTLWLACQITKPAVVHAIELRAMHKGCDVGREVGGGIG